MAIKKTYIINVPVEKVWEALTVPAVIESWGAGEDVVMDESVGTEFSLWDGDVTGTNVEVVPCEKLVQHWYGGDWKKPSILTIELLPVKEGTKVLLTHTDVPIEEENAFSEGWDEYYFGPMKRVLEGEL